MTEAQVAEMGKGVGVSQAGSGPGLTSTEQAYADPSK